jgi:hypothetical protein
MVTPAGNQPAGVCAGDITRSDQARSWSISSTKAVEQISARVSRGSEACTASGVMTASNSSVYLLELDVCTRFSFFQVETFARVYYFMVRTEQLLDDWMKALAVFIHYFPISYVATS